MRVLPCRPTTRDLISSMSCSVLSTGSSASMRTTSPRCPPPSLLWGLHSFKRQCTGPLSLHSTLRRHRLSLKAVYEESMAHVILRFSQPLTLREAIGTALPSPACGYSHIRHLLPALQAIPPATARQVQGPCIPSLPGHLSICHHATWRTVLKMNACSSAFPCTLGGRE